jgi:hypothetical protein
MRRRYSARVKRFPAPTACALALLAAACATPAPPITSPPAALRLDPFYRKALDAGGIPITASARAPDAALYAARDIVVTMLSKRPDLRRQLVATGQRVGVMAADEMTTDLPEQRDWKKPKLDDSRLTYCEKVAYQKIAALSDRDYWNTRTRGMGGLYATAGAENLLGQPGDLYHGETILVHEFGHSVLDAIQAVDPKLYAEVEAAYANAQATGLWKGSYGMVTLQEYWAEGTQFWFNSNFAYKRAPDLVVATDADLKRYDPRLYAVLAQVYPASHHIRSDPFWMNPARLNSPIVPEDGHEVC